jgi:predicted O-methyltransferase YrrM
MEFKEALAKYIRLRGNVASGQVSEPRNRGRWALAISMAEMEFRAGAEIGTLHGDSAEMWCRCNPQLHLTCIDPYGEYRKRHGRRQRDGAFNATKERLSPFNVTMMRTTSAAAVVKFKDASLDFVHIDGDHSFDAAMQDIIAWTPKVRIGGLVIVHDYFSLNWQGVTQAVDAYVEAHRIGEWYVTPDVSPTAFWVRA